MSKPKQAIYCMLTREDQMGALMSKRHYVRSAFWGYNVDKKVKDINVNIKVDSGPQLD